MDVIPSWGPLGMQWSCMKGVRGSLRYTWSRRESIFLVAGWTRFWRRRRRLFGKGLCIRACVVSHFVLQAFVSLQTPGGTMERRPAALTVLDEGFTLAGGRTVIWLIEYFYAAASSRNLAQ